MWESWTPREGGVKKCLNYELRSEHMKIRKQNLNIPILNVKLAFKMFVWWGLLLSISSQIQKYLNLIQKGGGSKFLNYSEIQKV